MPKIVAVSASLRNARWGKGVKELIHRIRTIANQDELIEFVTQEGQVHYQQFLDAGREKGLPFDEMYKNLKKMAGDKGLCNSEIGMAAGLWGASQKGCEIDYIPLSSYFGPRGNGKNLEQLREKLRGADGLLLCTPVYFGDRSSLASDLIEMIRVDRELRESLAGKPMAGIAVGAKRNGGQETTLIYQLLEMINIGMIGLGNDTETTSQYGGTLVAGDVGEASKDIYGLKTAIGAGRRLGRITVECSLSKDAVLKDKLRVMFWILQDDESGFARRQVERLVKMSSSEIHAEILDINQSKVGRCMACDICPTKVGPDSEYRCIIRRKEDPIHTLHGKLLDQDLIVPVALSTRDRSTLKTTYQRFIERTRYIRRGDYLFTDVAIMPLVFEELGATENMHIRMYTSLIRHHTLLIRPNVAYIHRGHILNEEEMLQGWLTGLKQCKKVAVGRLFAFLKCPNVVSYNPVGYILSAAKVRELSVQERRKILQQDRLARQQQEARVRLGTVGQG